MHDNKPPDGNLALPEYQSLQQIYRTLYDKVSISGKPSMGTYLVEDEMIGLMILGPPEVMMRLSRLIATIGSSPIVKMPGH